ncbi:MAG: transcriptional regulator [Fluviibacter sp.]|jgi:DNA-binding transcriptional regulator YdaS (Cro superfamily)
MIESGTFIALIKHFETQAALGRAVGVTPSAISQWVRRRAIPAEHAITIERVTDGKFRAVDLA